MVTQAKISLDYFKQFVLQPENTDRLFELVNGEIVEVMPGRSANSQIHDIIVAEVRPFCKAHGLPCYTASADGAFDVQGQVFAPNFAYKRTPMSNDYPDPVAPLWAVEIISPTDKIGEIRKKRDGYRNARILLWEIYPDEHSVDVYIPGQPVQTFGMNDTLDVGDLLPNFTLAVRTLFDE